MSFLDKVKNAKMETPAAAAPVKVNPFGAKTNPLTATTAVKPNPLAAAKVNPLAAAKTNPLTKKVEESVPEETKAPASTAAPAPKPNPFAKKAEAPVKGEEKTSAAAIADAAQEVTAEKSKKEMKKETDAINEATKPVADAPVIEAAPVVEEAPVAETAPMDAPAEEPAAKGKRSRSKAPAKKEEVKDTAKESPAETVAGFFMPTTSCTYSEAIASIKSPFVEPDWETFRKKIEEQIAAIDIEADMNPATLKKAVAALGKIRQQIWSPYQDTKTLFEQLSSKEPEGLIERIKKVNLGDGGNDLLRKKAGIEACMSYIPANTDTPVNLYEVLDETRARYNFLRNSMDSVSFKSQALITMNGALKLEGSLAPAEA